MSKSIYVCGSFIDEQYLWIIPIICSFAKEKKVSKIYFEKIPNKRKLTPENLKLIKEFEINEIESRSILKKKLLMIYYMIKNFKIFTYIYFNLKKEKLLSKKTDWTYLQFLHGTWDDINLNRNENNQLKVPFKKKILAILKGIYQMEFGKKLLRSGIKYYFISHIVYEKRWLISYLRQHKVQIFTQSCANIHRQKKNHDVAWSDINLNIVKRLQKNKQTIEKYWTNRILGKGNYSASNESVFSKKNKQIKLFKNHNLILPHIFRDSPFREIDKNRIFVDYFDWFETTLRIIKNSSEDWYIKIHPIYKRWGEDQPKIVKTLVNKIFNQNIPKNIKIIYDHPKLQLFKNANRIITFSGTSAIESVVFGKKPIVICKTIMERFNKKSVFRPKSLKEYENLLLKNKSFNNEKSKVFLAKRIIYARENIYSIGNLLGNDDIYRNDTYITKKRSYNKVYKNVKIIGKFLKEQGIKLSEGQTHTFINIYK